jgi:hypothetical protein
MLSKCWLSLVLIYILNVGFSNFHTAFLQTEIAFCEQIDFELCRSDEVIGNNMYKSNCPCNIIDTKIIKVKRFADIPYFIVHIYYIVETPPPDHV